MTVARVVRNELTKHLPVNLSAEEIEELTQEVMTSLSREEELKQDRRNLNRKIKGVVEARNNAHEKLEAGSEEAPVSCEEIWNFEMSEQPVELPGGTIEVEPNSVSVVRRDTLEFISTREITEEERSNSLFGQDNAPDSEEKTLQ